MDDLTQSLHGEVPGPPDFLSPALPPPPLQGGGGRAPYSAVTLLFPQVPPQALPLAVSTHLGHHHPGKAAGALGA